MFVWVVMKCDTSYYMSYSSPFLSHTNMCLFYLYMFILLCINNIMSVNNGISSVSNIMSV